MGRSSVPETTRKASAVLSCRGGCPGKPGKPRVRRKPVKRRSEAATACRMRTSSGEPRAAREPRHPGACLSHAPPKPLPKAKPAGGPPDCKLDLTPRRSFPRGSASACATDRFSHDQGQESGPGSAKRARHGSAAGTGNRAWRRPLACHAPETSSDLEGAQIGRRSPPANRLQITGVSRI